MEEKTLVPRQLDINLSDLEGPLEEVVKNLQEAFAKLPPDATDARVDISYYDSVEVVIMYRSPMTEREINQKLRAEESYEAVQRAQYERLKAKFGE